MTDTPEKTLHRIRTELRAIWSYVEKAVGEEIKDMEKYIKEKGNSEGVLEHMVERKKQVERAIEVLRKFQER